MGKYNYESLKNAKQEQETTKKEYQRIGYFNLWDEKPSAIVRFDVGSSDDLELVDVHNEKITKDDGKWSYRWVACLRNNDEPFKNCPLCTKNVKTRRTVVFVRMLEYRIGEDGKVSAVPVTWARASTFADELVSLINDYGDLRELLFKVTRNRTNNKTTYSVRLQPEMGIYTEAAGYVKDFSAFDNFLMNKHSYMERTFEELEEFVKTGKMASRKPKDEKESKNLETLIENVEESARVEEALGMTDEPDDEISFSVSTTPAVDVVANTTTTPTTQEPSIQTTSNTNTQTRERVVEQPVEDNNPTTIRRRKYDFSKENEFTNPF